MAQGWFQTGICYADQQQAIDAHFDSIPPDVHQSTTESTYYTYQKHPDGQWQFVSQSITSTGSLSTNYAVNVPTISQTRCDLLNDPETNFKNGMELGWGVAVVMIAVYLITRLKRGT